MNRSTLNPPKAATLSFSSARTFDAATPSDKDILTCEIYRRVTRELTSTLFETELQAALEGGLAPVFSEATFEHYTFDGRFDHAECRLKLANLGPSRFLLHTSFYLGDTLVTTVVQGGAFAFEDLL